MKNLFLFIILSITTLQASNLDYNPTLDSLNLTIQLLNRPNNLGEKYFTAGQSLDKPISVLVSDSLGNPAFGIPIEFEILSMPENSKNAYLSNSLVISDSNGIALTNLHLGDKSGSYNIMARVASTENEVDHVYYKVNARSKNWIFLLLSGLIGGLGFFLFGMKMLSTGLKKTAGSRLRAILSTVTNNRLFAIGVGTLITIIVQSSSATTVMLVGFVSAGLMTFTQTLGMILGAGIGTTITVQLIAFKITDYSLLMIGVGVAMIFMSSSKKYKNIGEAILGFGILFFGMQIMSEAMRPLRTFKPFIDILIQLENPILGILAGTIITAIIQSSAASIGIVLILSTQGLISLEASIPLILGANIGTSITAVLSSINSERDAKRVALANSLIKILGVLIFVWWIPEFAKLVREISPATQSNIPGDEFAHTIIPRQIANAHTIFNLAVSIIFLPFLNLFGKLISKILPDKPSEEILPYKTRFIEESFISTPALALSLAKAEILKMADLVKSMDEKIITPLFINDTNELDEIKEMEKEIDFVYNKTKSYLTEISQQDLENDRIEEAFQIMQCAAEFEQIADLISKNLRRLAKTRIKHNLIFSGEGADEIKQLHLSSVKQISRAIDVFKDLNLERGIKLENKYQKYKSTEFDLKRSHFERLRQDIYESKNTTSMHLELIEIFLRINRHTASIGRIITGENENGMNEDDESVDNLE